MVVINYMKQTFINIFKISNIGTALFFVLNFSFLMCIFNPQNAQEVSVLVGIYLLSLLISFSPIGQWLLCFFNGARKMTRRDMKERIEPIVEDVFLKAKAKTPGMPNKINIKVMYDPAPNAFAIGLNTICVTEGLMNLPDNEIAGVIAHEMGHIALQHTVIQILIGGGNIIMTLIILVLQIINKVLMVGSTVRMYYRKNMFEYVGMLAALFSAGLIFIWTRVCMLLIAGSNRSNEFAADKYAFELGYGDDLCEVLDHLDGDALQNTWAKAFFSSHPHTGDRIGRLQQLGAEYSKY